MKKFLHILLIFCLPVLLASGTMELLLRHIPNGYTIKSDYLKTNNKSIKTLLVGSSHVFYGITPSLLSEKALNYGNVSQTIDVDYQIINQHIDSLESLETIVIRLSYTTLFEQLETGDESWRIKDYEIYTDINLDSKLTYHSEVLSVKLKNNLKRINDFYFLNEHPEFVSNQGWGKHTAREHVQNIDEAGRLIAEKHTIVADEVYEENYKTLEKIMDLCQKKDIKVILITMPAFESYVQNLDANQLEKTISAGRTMENEFHNCFYFNFLNDKRFTRDDFLDADHLNSRGAEKFTILLDSLITN